MKGFLIVLLAIFFQSTTKVFELPAVSKQIYTDNLGNLYVIDDFTLYKYNSRGDLLADYSDNFLGNITTIAIGTGLKVMVYYRDNAQLAVLDNTLSPISNTVNLNFYNLGTSTLATASVQNNFWFYDPMQGALIRTTNTLHEVFNSGNLAYLLNYEINPNYMVESNNKLYLNDPDNGIFVFDIFGTCLNTLSIKGLARFQVNEKGIYFFSEGHLYFYDFLSFDQTENPIPVSGAEQVLVSGQMIFVQTDSAIMGWQVKSIDK